MSESCSYRGYEIVLRREWSQWCASVYPTRPDLPIIVRSTLRTLMPRKDEALAEALEWINDVAGPHLSRAESGASTSWLASIAQQIAE
jgi:hypothetical protein